MKSNLKVMFGIIMYSKQHSVVASVEDFQYVLSYAFSTMKNTLSEQTKQVASANHTVCTVPFIQFANSISYLFIYFSTVLNIFCNR